MYNHIKNIHYITAKYKYITSVNHVYYTNICKYLVKNN